MKTYVTYDIMDISKIGCLDWKDMMLIFGMSDPKWIQTNDVRLNAYKINSKSYEG
jgi:hypothetical protein